MQRKEMNTTEHADPRHLCEARHTGCGRSRAPGTNAAMLVAAQGGIKHLRTCVNSDELTLLEQLVHLHHDLHARHSRACWTAAS